MNDSLTTDWITIPQAKDLLNKSDSTLRRYVKKFKNDQSKIQLILNSRGQDYYKLDRYSLASYFDIQIEKTDSQESCQADDKETSASDTQMNSGGTFEQSREPQPEHYLEKQSNDIIAELIQQRMPKPHIVPLYRSPALWTAIASIVIIMALVYGGYKYIGHQNQENTIKQKAFAQAYQEKLKQNITAINQLYSTKLNAQKEIYELKLKTSQEKINSLDQQLQDEKLKNIAPVETNPDGSSLTYLH